MIENERGGRERAGREECRGEEGCVVAEKKTREKDWAGGGGF